MLAKRGVVLSYETIQEWCLKLGQPSANDLRRRSSRPGVQWHLDEVLLALLSLAGWTGYAQGQRLAGKRRSHPHTNAAETSPLFADDATSDTIARIARRIGLHVVGFSMDD